MFSTSFDREKFGWLAGAVVSWFMSDRELSNICTVAAAQNCYELLSKFGIRETRLFRLQVICPGNFSNTSPVALRCPLATDSSTITGPEGGDGGAKEEGLSLATSALARPWIPFFRPTGIGGVGKPDETSEVIEQLFVSETVSMFWWICWYLIPSRNAWCRNARLPEFAWISDESTRVLQIQPAGCCAGIYPKPGVTSLNRRDRSHTLRPLHMMLSGARSLIERSACGGRGLNNPMQLRIKIVPLKAALKSRARSYIDHNWHRAGLRVWWRNQWIWEEAPTSSQENFWIMGIYYQWPIHSQSFTPHHVTDSISWYALASILWRSLEIFGVCKCSQIKDVKNQSLHTLTCLQIKMVAPMNSSVAIICVLSLPSLAGSLILWFLHLDIKHPATVVIQCHSYFHSFSVFPCFVIRLIRSSFVPSSSKFTMLTMAIVHGKSYCKCQDENLECGPK